MVTAPQQPIQTRLAWIGILVPNLLFIICVFGSKILIQTAGIHFGNDWLLLITRLMVWAWLGFTWMYAVRVEKQPLLLEDQQALPAWKFLLSVVIVLLAVLAGSILVNSAARFFHWSAASAKITQLTSAGVPLKIFTVVTAAIVEELIFRGYLLSRLNQLFRKGPLPVVFTSLLFSLAHISYLTVINVLIPLVIGLIFGVFQQRYRNIYVLITCHFLIDFYALLIAR